MKFSVRNTTRDVLLGDRIVRADTSETRRTGLLKHKSLPGGEGIWLVPCEGIHMFFMKFAIDALFLDRKCRVLRIAPSLKPWRISVCLRAHSVLEVAAGECERTGTIAGDQLEFQAA